MILPQIALSNKLLIIIFFVNALSKNLIIFVTLLGIALSNNFKISVIACVYECFMKEVQHLQIALSRDFLSTLLQVALSNFLRMLWVSQIQYCVSQCFFNEPQRFVTLPKNTLTKNVSMFDIVSQISLSKEPPHFYFATLSQDLLIKERQHAWNCVSGCIFKWHTAFIWAMSRENVSSGVCDQVRLNPDFSPTEIRVLKFWI